MIDYDSGASLSEVHETVDVRKQRKGWRRILPYLGPAYLVSVGYMDPGNWATDLQGGAQFGYKLIWVLLMSNLMALLLQSLSARLGIVQRKDLAQANRDTYPPLINFCLYILAELAIAACDLAEVLGMALGIQLLTGLPLMWGVIITVLDTFLIFYLQKKGIRFMEAFILALVIIIGVSFLIEIILAKPHAVAVFEGFIPTSLNHEALYIAVGIIGATVMPHNLYLHSALVQTRKIRSDDKSIRQALKYNFIDSAIALNAAFFVNAGILILSAAVFFYSGQSNVAKIKDAYLLLAGGLGTKLAPILFAVALIASGQSSTVTGTLAGQVVMEGYLNLRINPLLRRLITRLIAIIPAVIVIFIYGESKVDYLLILSQVLLSLQLGFAVIPLIHFVSNKKKMGVFAISAPVKIMSWIVAAILVFLNVRLVVNEMLGILNSPGQYGLKILIITGAIFFTWIFLVMTFFPLFGKRKKAAGTGIHASRTEIKLEEIKPFKKIAISLDFGELDDKVIAHALKQGGMDAEYLLLHIVETVGAGYSGHESDDNETRVDAEQLQRLAEQLTQKGFFVSMQLGYNDRVNEIVRIVKENNSDLLIMGAHRHSGLKDLLYGATVNQVRHKISIPVLIVNA